MIHVKNALDCHGNTLNEMAVTQERQLSDQSEVVNTWTREQNKLVEQVNTRVNQFLVEELKDDLPTGLSKKWDGISGIWIRDYIDKHVLSQGKPSIFT